MISFANLTLQTLIHYLDSDLNWKIFSRAFQAGQSRPSSSMLGLSLSIFALNWNSLKIPLAQ